MVAVLNKEQYDMVAAKTKKPSLKIQGGVSSDCTIKQIQMKDSFFDFR